MLLGALEGREGREGRRIIEEERCEKQSGTGMSEMGVRQREKSQDGMIEI